MVCLTFCVIYTIYSASQHIQTAHTTETIISVPTSIFVPSNINTQMEALCDAIAVLPNSPLKSNLNAVIGTEYAGGSIDLNNALKEFIQNQIRMLEREAAGTNKDL